MRSDGRLGLSPISGMKPDVGAHHPGATEQLQLRELVERAADADLVGTEVDRHELALHHDHAAEAVLVVGDPILNSKALDLRSGIVVVEGTAGKNSPPRRGS